MKSGKKILWFHTCPEHYVNSMIDALERTSDYTYMLAFAHDGSRKHMNRPPLAAQSVVLRARRHVSLDNLGRFDHIRRIHEDWRADLYPLNYDAVIVAGYARRTERDIIRDCKKRGIPVAMFSDSNLRSQRGRGLKMRMKRSVKHRILAPIIRDVDYLLTANRLGVAYWRYYGAPHEKIIVCPYYADYPRVEASRQTNRDTVLGSFGLAIDDKLIVTAARLVPAKGLHLMIRAFRELNLGARGWKYLIAGTGPLEQELKTLAGDDLGTAIRFIGFQEPPQVLALIHHAAFFAFPSVYEPHGVVVQESLAANTPVLSSNASGAAFDLIHTGRNGWLFRSGDQADLTRILKTATADESALTAMRPVARAVFEHWLARTNPVSIIDRLAHHMLSSPLRQIKPSRP